MAERGKSAGFWLENLAARALVSTALALPYRVRVPIMGWITSRVVAPLAGFNKRVRHNLAHACPELSDAEVQQIVRGVTTNVGRVMIESYSGAAFVDRLRRAPFSGPGVETLDTCRAEGNPAVMVSGHFGNHNAARGALVARGYPIGALYNPMKNAYFNAHYVDALAEVGTPLYPRGRRGLAHFVRHLREGGMAGILVDQYMHQGALVTFFGQPAPTALSAAELALKYECPLVPAYAIRSPNGLDFEIIVEAPIPHSDPMTMTQAINDSLEARVRTHMDQWFWVHRRWKPERHGTLSETTEASD